MGSQSSTAGDNAPANPAITSHTRHRRRPEVPTRVEAGGVITHLYWRRGADGRRVTGHGAHRLEVWRAGAVWKAAVRTARRNDPVLPVSTVFDTHADQTQAMDWCATRARVPRPWKHHMSDAHGLLLQRRAR